MLISRRVALSAAVVASVVGTALPSFVAHAAVTDLYVNNRAANCDDYGSGTQAQPYCTVQIAADAAQPGQTVHIAQGFYNEQVTVKHSGTQGSPITFLGVDPAPPVWPNWGAWVGGSPRTGYQPHAFVLSGVHDIAIKGLVLNATQEGALVSDSSRIAIDFDTLGSVGNQFSGSQAPAVRLTGKTTATTISRDYVSGSGKAGVQVDAGVAGSVITTNYITGNQAGGVAVTDAPGTVVTSNTITQNYGFGVSLAGASSGSTVENNILNSNKIGLPGSTNPDVELSVSADSVSGTTADYNIVHAALHGTDYAWGASSYTSSADFRTGTGQGAHDFDVDPGVSGTQPPSAKEAVDSADANAPGELSTDSTGAPRIDDPLIANTGTGVGYHDRGAIERPDPLSVGGSAYFANTPGHPLDVQITPNISSAWGLKSASVDFGDGKSAQLTASNAGFTHTYAASGSYQVTFTATSAAGTTKTSSAYVYIPAIGPLDTQFYLEVPDPAILSVTLHDATTSPWPVTSYTVDFGDGTPAVVTDGSNRPASLRHDYASGGRQYVITETVVDNQGRSKSTSTPYQAGTNAHPAPGSRTIEAVEDGEIHEVFWTQDTSWQDHRVPAVGSPVSALGFRWSASGARVIEAVENGQLHEIYSDDASNWHDGAVTGTNANITTLGFSYSPSGARVIEAIEGGVLHEIYSAADGWHDNPIEGTAGNATALGFSYSPSGARVIEAIEGGVLHEIYSAADGWHDNPIEGTAGNATAFGFSYSPSGARVIEAIEGGVLHEIYSAPDGWHDAAIQGTAGNATAVSSRVSGDGSRAIEAVENGQLHEIYSDASGWHDNLTDKAAADVTAISMAEGPGH